jgi:uncharacterized protein (TIGR02246 family)
MTANQNEITSVVARLADAWKHHDADVYGALFTADATYITFVGTRYKGRLDIVKSHSALFNGPLKGTSLAIEIDDVRFFGGDTAVATGRGDTFKSKQPSRLIKVQTYTLIREADGQWRIAAFHNTKRRPLMEALSFKFIPGSKPALK